MSAGNAVAGNAVEDPKSRPLTREGAYAAWPAHRVLVVALLVFVGCALGAHAGTELVFPVSGTAILFPPYAVLTAALLLTPTRAWGAFVVAASAGNFVPHLASEGSLSFVALAETANVTRALVAAGGLRLLGWPARLGSLTEMALFLAFVGLFGPAAGAFLGATDVVLHSPDADFWRSWQAWLLSNALTGVTLLPAMMLVGRRGVAWLKPMGFVRWLEALTLLAGLTTVGIHSFARAGGGSALPAYLYGPLPLLVWSAIRFGTSGAIVAVSVTAAFAIEGVVTGRGPFVLRSPDENALHLQLFLMAVTVPVLLLSAVVEQLTHAAAELRHGQARYRSVVEDQTEMICRFGPDGTYTFVNGAYCRAFGTTPEELVGRSFWAFIPPAGHQEARDFLAAITPENPVATYEHEVIGAGGQVRWQQWTDRGLFDAQGRLLEYQAVGRDVTDRKQAEQERRLLESQRHVEETLRETDRRKDEFLAMLAHELRNPLASVSLALEMMRGQPLTEDSASARDIIARQVVQLTRLVDDLLDISRVTLAKITLTFESVEVVPVVRQAVEAIRPMMESRGHNLMVSLPPLSVHTRADPARLAQIVSNLLDNAARYTEPGGRIYLVVSQERSDVVLTVGDNGVGIAPDQLSRIFEPFTQVRGSIGTANGGLGIGLTLVKQLVELHGGRITARSAGLGEGSEFVVRLPALAVAEAGQRADAPAPEPEQPPLKILVVDDNVDAATALARLLRTWGHTVKVSSDGVEALEAETAFAPNAVLLDLGLPRMDGLEVARRMRQRRPSDPLLLVALTGFGQASDRRRTADAGFDRHFTKPMDIRTLQALLSDWGLANGEAGGSAGARRA